MSHPKDVIANEASSFINKPETILKVLASRNFSELYSNWSDSLAVSFQKYLQKTRQFENKVKEQKKNIIYGILANTLFTIAIYLFLHDKSSCETLECLLLLYVPYYIGFIFFNYTLLKLRIINFSSIALKELSLLTAMSFDHFFQNDLTKEQYNKLNDLESIEKYEDHRLYLELSLGEITRNFAHTADLNPAVKVRCLENLVVYQKELLKQFDSRAYLHINYSNIFKHNEYAFK